MNYDKSFIGTQKYEISEVLTDRNRSIYKFFIETQEYEISKVLTDGNQSIFVLKRDNVSIFEIIQTIKWSSDKDNISTDYSRCIIPFRNDHKALGVALAYLKKYET